MTYRKFLAALWLAFLSFFAGSSSWAQFPNDATFTTLSLAPFGTEGLTGDKNGNLYTGGNAGTNCPIWRTSINSPSATLSNSNVIGTISGSCNPLGIALNRDGDVFVANGATGEIYTFVPNAVSPPAATLFASGVLPTRTPDDVYRAIVLERLPSFVREDAIGAFSYIGDVAPLTGRCRGP